MLKKSIFYSKVKGMHMNRRIFPFVLVIALLATLAISVVGAQEVVPITVRCQANEAGGEGWRCNNFAEVEAQVEADLGIEIQLTLNQSNMDWADYKTEFLLASEAGEAPDIILSGHEDIGAWGEAGLIIPLEDLIAQHEEFEDVVANLWESQKYNGVIYGIPQDAEARPIFFSKLLLRDLGWSEEDIESLPQRVADGEYTFADMLATAQEAIDEGVIEEGNGYWHRTSNGFDWLMYYFGMGGEITDEEGNLVWDSQAILRVYELVASLPETGVTRPDMIGLSGNDVWHPAVSAADQVLFAQGGTWNWGGWAKVNVADRGGNDYLLPNIGLMLFPALDAGRALTLTHPLSYMISAASPNPDVAMALIAAVTTPDANNRHAIDSFHLGILNSQVESEAYLNDPVLSSAHYMLDYTTGAPNNPDLPAWQNAYWVGIQAAETGSSTPQEALELATQQLQNELGDKVVYR
jgi:inositol-phosphate transport system substrate-binding protein